MSHYLSAADLIIARLRSRLTIPTANIRPAISLDWAVKNALSPAVSVIFFDDVPNTAPSGNGRLGKSQLSDQHWLVLVSQRNVTDAGAVALNDMGGLLTGVLTALQGWQLSDQHGPLYRQKCAYRKTDREGFVHFPFQFSTGVVVKGVDYQPYTDIR